MESIRSPRAASAAGRTRRWRARSKQVVAAFVLVASTSFVGLASPADAIVSPVTPHRLASRLEAAVPSDAERALGARLAMQYSGAVPAADVELLVRRVGLRLRAEASPSQRLLRTTEAVARRALTDYLARGVPLPVG